MSISRDELQRRLHFTEVDSEDLLELIIFHQETCRAVDDRQLILPSEGPANLVLDFSATGRLTGIRPGPALAEGVVKDLEKEVQAQLLKPPVPRVARRILYATEPINGYWRFRDSLVLRPVPEGNPKPPPFIQSHPLVLECAYMGMADTGLDASRGERVISQFASFLGLAVPHLDIPPPGRSRQAWATATFQRPGETRRPASEWVLLGYRPANWGPGGDGLSPKGNLGAIPVTDDWSEWPRPENFHLPSYLYGCLKAFVELESGNRRLLLRAAHWINHAKQVRWLSESAAYTAVIQSVEVLIEDAVGATPTKDFRAFIDQYAPATSETMRRMHRDLYRIRSQISHGSRLFVSDAEIGFLPNPRRMHEQYVVDHAIAVCRTAVLNWLLSRARRDTRQEPAGPQGQR